MKNMPTFNTLRVANEMKKVWKNSDESEGCVVRNKLLYLYIGGEKFLGNQLSPHEIVDAAINAHEADFDAYMTSRVFEAMLYFSNAHPTYVFLKPCSVHPCSVHVARILAALKEVGDRHGIKLVSSVFLHILPHVLHI